MNNLKKRFVPVMLTPFLANGSIDFTALTQLTEMYLNSGASGLFANCLSSEMFELTAEERLKAIGYVIKVVNGAVPVVATGTFGGSVKEQADYVKRVHDLGTEAVIVISSLLAEEQESDELFDKQVFELIDQTDSIPLGFYECPVPYKRLLSPSQLEAFVATGRIIYHKDTSLSLDAVKEKIRLTAGHKFGLYDAYMGHAVESLKAGSAGLSCIQGNYFPELIVWLCDNYDNLDRVEEVSQVQLFLIEHMDVMHNVYPIVSKYFLNRRGMAISTFTRREVGILSSSIIKEIEHLFDAYSILKSDLDLPLIV
jgi:4-hydroxy-tetrahydrodipicolinate synthase